MHHTHILKNLEQPVIKTKQADIKYREDQGLCKSTLTLTKVAG